MAPVAVDETLHLMVVDDEPGMRLGIERALEGFVYHVEQTDTRVAFRVTKAESGEQALEMAADARPDIMLLDHQLPGMSGIDVLGTILEKKLEILVVVITAHGTLENAVRATKLGAFDFLAKPFAPQELRAVVCKAVDHFVLQRQARRLAEERRKIRFEFLTVLAHELKAPLAAVEGYLRILQDPQVASDAASRQHMVDRSLVRLEGMRKLIFDLLDLTRIESGQKRRRLARIDVLAVAKAAIDTVAPSAREKNVSVELHAGSPVEMVADGEEIEIIMNNLLSNAVKYNREGGRVDLTCERRNGKVVIAVSDTGIGMTAEEVGRLFGEFSRIRNAKTANILGSGLGLSIVKRLAALYGGSVEVRSEPDAGSTFTVVLGEAVATAP